MADGVKERVHANECHVEAVAVDRVLERFEGMVEIIDAKIIYADLISGAGAGCGGVESAGVCAPIGLPSVLPVHAKKSGAVELWLGLVQRQHVLPYGLVPVALLLIDEASVIFHGAGPLLHLGGALQLSKCGIVSAVVVKSNAQPAVDEER